MRTKLVLMLTGGILLATLPAWAHHSFAAEFDANQPVTLRGVLTKMEWFNPHGWIYIDVAQPDGKVVKWAIEAGAPTALLRRGLRKTDSRGHRGRRRGLPRQGRGAESQRQDGQVQGRSQFLPGRGRRSRRAGRTEIAERGSKSHGPSRHLADDAPWLVYRAAA